MRFRSGGEVVAVECPVPRIGRLIAGAVGAASATDDPPTVRLIVQPGGRLTCTGLRPVTRGAWSDGRRTLLVDAGGSGFDLLVTADEDLEVIARYAPRAATYAANLVLAQRFRLLAGQVLVHYPVLWRAGWRGRVPLHASVLHGPTGTPLLAGPGGVGKSRVVLDALREGSTVAADNLCVADERTCYGLAEPLRVDSAGVGGRRTTHGRVELRLATGATRLDPDRVIVLERGAASECDDVKPDEAARALVTGTYAAGELRRYWAFAATLALATGRGPAHPPLAEVAQAYTNRLRCLRMRVGDGDRVCMDRLCGVASGAERDGAR